jgi:uncharacterized protein YecT (DUF1311 family)
MTLHYAGGKVQMAFDDVLIPVTLGNVDSDQETVNLNVTPKSGSPIIWTVRRIWDKERKSFHLSLTLHDGKQDDFSFVRKVSTEDVSRMTALQNTTVPPTRAEAPQPVVASKETAPTAAEPDSMKVDVEETAGALAGYSASFDCGKAVTTIETLVCPNESIGQLDGLLAATYRQRSDVQFGADPVIMKTEQREWLKKRNACPDAECVESAYRNRIKELCELPVVSDVHPGGDCERI